MLAILRIVCLLLTALGMVTYAQAQVDDYKSPHTKPLVASCIKAGWPPYWISSPDPNDSSGIMADVLREICRSLNREIRFVYLPEMRSRLRLKSGELDLYPEAKEWVDNPDDFLWSDPVLVSSDHLVFLKGKALDATAQGLAGKSLAVMWGFGYPTLAPLFHEGSVKKYSVQSAEQLLNMVVHERVDAAVINRTVADWVIKHHPEFAEVVFCEEAIDSAPYRYAFRKTQEHRAFLVDFNRELEAMKRDGRLQRIFKKYQ